MKKFLRNIALELSILTILITSALVLGPIRVAHSESVWHIPAEKHILFCGASAITLGINDSLTTSAINVSKQSERYMFTYIRLKQYIKYNPQIDTVFMQFAPTDTWRHADDKYFDDEHIEFMPLYWSLMGREEWHYLKEDWLHISEVMFPRFRLLHNWNIKEYRFKQGGYLAYSDSLDSNTNYPQKAKSELQKGNNINLYYCRKIIELCEAEDIKLYFLFMPVWRLYEAYDIDYYYMVYNELFSDVEMIDYSNLEVSNEERYDAYHLNARGAKKITNLIKEEYNIQ